MQTYLLLVLIGIRLTAAVVVNTTGGRLEGFRDTVLGEDIDTYYGVPYATPPTGQLRFAASWKHEGWSGIREAKVMKPSCIQNRISVPGQPLRNDTSDFSEDCLYLNIWVPAKRVEGTKLATIIWVYGTSFTKGTNNLPLTNGKILAAENNVIVVAINYRVGALGFMYLDLNTFPGNQGLTDQMLALEWTYANIEQFGGDRTQITLLGEGTGAAFVGYHLLSPLSNSFFTRAIIQSGAPNANWAVMSQELGTEITMKFVKEAGCHSDRNDQYRDIMYNCMMELTTKEILDVQNRIDTGLSFVPVVDFFFLQNNPIYLFRTGHFSKIPLLIGVNKNEGSGYLASALPQIFSREDHIQITKSQFIMAVKLLSRLLGDVSVLPTATVNEYAPDDANHAPYSKIADEILGDGFFKCPMLRLINEASFATNIYAYSFERRVASLSLPKWMGVPHSYELEFVFGHPVGGYLTVTEEEAALSRAVMTYWTNFAKTGNPNLPVSQATEWPKYTKQFGHASDGRYLVLDVGDKLRVARAFREKQCAFWNEKVPLIAPDSRQPSNSVYDDATRNIFG